MIQYREYNVKAPLNSEAARWVRHAEAQGIFPIGSVPLCEPEVEISVDGHGQTPSGGVALAPAISIDPDEEELT